MIELITTHLDNDFLSFLSSLFGLVPAGVLLAVMGWLVSYLVYGLLALFKK